MRVGDTPGNHSLKDFLIGDCLALLHMERELLLHQLHLNKLLLVVPYSNGNDCIVIPVETFVADGMRTEKLHLVT